MPKNQLDALTGLRFLAALHVVVFHSRSLFSAAPQAIQDFLFTGSVAVALFFTLSGFVLTINYAAPDRSAIPNLRQFWAARFARIYPLYLVAFILFTPAVFSANSPGIV